MASACLLLTWLFLQPEPPALFKQMLRSTLIVAAVMIVFVVVIFVVFRAMRSKPNAGVEKDFERSKDALLLLAQQKKALREKDISAKQAAEADEQERSLLKEGVDPGLVIGQTCPLCGLELMEDQDLVIDPYTGRGYHLSSFLHDWPLEASRPKYIYRYPQDTIVRTDDLLRLL